MFALSEGELLDASQLPERLSAPSVEYAAVTDPAAPSVAIRSLDEMEKQAVLAAVATAQGNLTRAAKALGISRSTLYVKLAAIREAARTTGGH